MEQINLNMAFLQRLQGGTGITEISDLIHNLGGIDNYEDIIDGFSSFSDLYFISFLPNEKWEQAKEKEGRLPRTKNEFVKGINYLKADFDIRSYFFEHDKKIISNEQLLKYAKEITDGLKENGLDYSAVIFSGNGIHVYWIGEMMDFTEKSYAEASRLLYLQITDIFKDRPELQPDYACKNIGRMLRLPGSYNHKSKYGLPPQEVKILEYKEEVSPVVADYEEQGRVSIFCDIASSKDYKISDFKKESRQKFTKGLIKKGTTYDAINQEIDIGELVCRYTGRRIAPTGKHFISQKDGKYTGAFMIPEENVVVWGGTPHLSSKYTVYSPFSFILVHYADGDVKRTFKVAEEMFPEVGEDKPKYLFTEGLIKNGEDN